MNRTLRSAACGAILAAAGLLWPAEALAAKKILRLRLDGPVLESPNDATGLFAVLKGRDVNTLQHWVRTIHQAAASKEIAGLLLIIEQPELSLAQVEELTRALKSVREKGKPVYCYLDEAGNLSYALAAAADRITIAEHGELDIVGLQAELVYFKGLMDKLGLEAEMMHCGAYKSALEPFTRTEPSPEAAENVNWLLDSLYDRWLKLIADGRGLSVDDVKKLVDAAPLTADAALKAKLVDEVSSFPAFKKMVQKEFGKDVEALKRLDAKPRPEIDLENPFALLGVITEMIQGVAQPTGPGVGLIYVDGPIIVGTGDDSPFASQTAGSTKVRAALEAAREDENVRAVVLRVNSPGGSALASDIIWDAARRCAEEKPLIVSMGGVAGSGGYYVATPGDTVFAEATTITGSIGVVGGKLVWKGLLGDKLGITTAEFGRGQHAGLLSPNRKWNDAERAWMTDYMNATYEQFKGRITKARGERLKKDLEQIAGGRVYTGAQALELGLVDKLGGLSDAIDLAASKAGLGRDYEIYNLPKASDLAAFLNFLRQLTGKDAADEFEVGVAGPPAADALSRLPTGTLLHPAADALLRKALPLLGELAPAQTAELLRTLRNLTILQREHVGCFMPAVPQVR
jgi:protease-4